MAGDRKRSEASTSSSNSKGETVVIDCGRRKSTCGYCKSTGRTSITHGLWANSLTVDDYQDLLDQGWRRSGCYLYKPEMEKTCCPSYTIRLRANDFSPSKEQLRVLKRIQKFLDGTLDAKKSLEKVEDQNANKSACSCTCHLTSTLGRKESVSDKNEMNRAKNKTNYLSNQLNSALCVCIDNGDFPKDIQFPKAMVKTVSQAKRKLLTKGAENLIYSSSIAFQISATLRRLKPAQGDSGTDQSSVDGALSPQVVAEKLVASVNRLGEATDLSIRTCNGHINFYSRTAEAVPPEGSLNGTSSKLSGDGCKRKNCCVEKNLKPREGKRQRLEIHLKRSSFDPKEFALYRRYQMIVHNDTPEHVTESSYRRFLVETPLVTVSSSGDGTAPPCGFGSFHQQYLIDGKLVAVGVVDILPRCLSSKYLFWDPDFAFLSLGKYSALQEINWVKDNQVHCPSLQYYYLGYYIHSCSKMRYKGAYRPSELLCPLRYQWISFDVARPLLDQKKYVVLSDIPLRQNGEVLPAYASENSMQIQQYDNDQGESNDVPLDHDEAMIEPEFEGSEDESGSESDDLTIDEIETDDVGDILIGLKGACMRYRDLRQAIGPNERGYLELQLHRYKKVVGAELSEQMVYSLG